MGTAKLDGAGQAKMTTLDDAMILYSRVNSVVENFALAVKRSQPSAPFMINFKRQMPSLASKLKGQFGMISDLVTATIMSGTRGSSHQMRVRAMREGMAAIRVQLDIAIAQTLTKHEVKD